MHFTWGKRYSAKLDKCWLLTHPVLQSMHRSNDSSKNILPYQCVCWTGPRRSTDRHLLKLIYTKLEHHSNASSTPDTWAVSNDRGIDCCRVAEITRCLSSCITVHLIETISPIRDLYYCVNCQPTHLKHWWTFTTDCRPFSSIWQAFGANVTLLKMTSP